MDSNKQSEDHIDMYFTSRKDLDEAKRRRELELAQKEPSHEKGYTQYEYFDSTSSIEPYPENNEISDMVEEYVLPPPNQSTRELREPSHDRGHTIYQNVDSTISIEPDLENNERNDMVEEYVLPPPNQRTRESPVQVAPRPTRRREVRDLYDDEHYALPDVSGCVTRGAGGRGGVNNQRTSQKKSATKLRISVA